MSTRTVLIRLGWSVYRPGPILAIVVFAGLTLGWVPTLFFGSLLGGLFAWLMRSARKDVQRLQTDPEFAARFEQEQARYFKATGLAVPVAMGVLLILLVVVAIAR